MNHLGCADTTIESCPSLGKTIGSTVANHIVGCAVDIDEWNRTRGIGATARTAHRSKGGNLVGYVVHGMDCEHTSHREARQIDSVFVDAIAVVHRVDNRFDEVEVAIA